MSIIIPLIYSKDGAQVQRATVPVGYDLPTYDVFVEKMIAEVLTHIRLFPDKLPAFDEVKSLAPGYPMVTISGGAFSAVQTFAQLLRAGADPVAVVKQASDHLEALGKLDRVGYSEADEKEYQDAVLVTSQFIVETEDNA